MDNSPDAFARLNERIEQLEQRVFHLERLSDHTEVVLPALTSSAVNAQPVSERFNLDRYGETFVVTGKAMFGIAGAYLLRALAESRAIPTLIVVILALSYAAVWLIWSAWTGPKSRLAGILYAITATVILAPMLWELTLVFKVLAPSITASILVILTLLASALAWKHNLVWLVWIANVASVFMAFALMIGSRNLPPFLLSLVCITVVGEVAAYLHRWHSLRPLFAIWVDLALTLAIYLGSSPESARSGYITLHSLTLIALSSFLVTIYGISVVARTLISQGKITPFEIAQTSIAFLLTVFAVLEAGNPHEKFVLGVSALLLSVLCYLAALWVSTVEPRNYHVYATWGLILFVLASFLCFRPQFVAFCFVFAATAATFLGFYCSRLTLELHGIAYLTLAASVSGLLMYAGRALAGTFPKHVESVDCVVAGAAIVCYGILGRYRGETPKQRVLHLLSGTLAVSAVATFVVTLFVWLTALGVTPSSSHIAVTRTLTICLLAIVLAFLGSRLQRIELAWIAYGMLGLTMGKLLFEDVHYSHPAFIALSLFLYAASLMSIPRVVRAGEQAVRVQGAAKY